MCNKPGLSGYRRGYWVSGQDKSSGEWNIMKDKSKVEEGNANDWGKCLPDRWKHICEASRVRMRMWAYCHFRKSVWL